MPNIPVGHLVYYNLGFNIRNPKLDVLFYILHKYNLLQQEELSLGNIQEI